MTDIEKLRKALKDIGIPSVVRELGEYEYLFIGSPEDAQCITGMDDNFGETNLDALLVRHKFFEFENGALASWSAS